MHLKNTNAQGKTTVSRADLSTGIEIKTVYTSKSENTFKSHMESVANKSGGRFATFDVSENKTVTDSQAEAWIRKYMKRYEIAEVRMLRHDGSLQTIRRYEKAIGAASPAAQLLSAGSGCHNGL